MAAVNKTSTRLLKVGAAAVVLVALIWLFLNSIRSTNSEPYTLSSSALTGWRVAAGSARDPGVVVLQAPSALTAPLFQQIFKRTMQSLSAPPAPVMPLVLADEFADSLQGVHGIDDVMRIAREAGLESARFEPVCLARRQESAPGRSGELYFVAFDAPAFTRFRQMLPPMHQEHAGTGVFDPAALSPLLPIAATTDDFGRWWPLAFDRERDCLAPIDVR
jgi:hypothetical protein